MFESPIIVALAVTGAVLCAGCLFMQGFGRYDAAVAGRLQALTDKPKSASLMLPGETQTPVGNATLRDTWVSMVRRLLPKENSERARYESRFSHAGIYSSGMLTAFFTVKLLLLIVPPIMGLALAGLGFVDQQMGLLGGCLAGAVGMLLPSFWLDRKVKLRSNELRRSVPDMLDLMIVCMEGGLSLQGTIQRVGDELRSVHAVLANELALAQRDMELGIPVDGALRRMADRTGFDGIRSLATFVRESQKLGTELVQALRLHADMLRLQREQSAEELAQKASVKILFPTLLLILPAVFVVLAGPAAIQIQEAFAKK